MARHVVSLIRNAPNAVRSVEPSLEANAYAVAEDVDLTVILRGRGVELALVGAEVRPGDVAGVALPPPASGQDLLGLVESGVSVIVVSEDAERLGLVADDLVPGVRPVDEHHVADLLRSADAVLLW